MGDLASAEPQTLRAFDDAASSTAEILLRRATALEVALSRLSASGSAGLAGVRLELGTRLRDHAHLLHGLGTRTGRVGAAFAAAGSGERVVRGVSVTGIERILDAWSEADSYLAQLPDDAPAVVPGANGCPAVALPTWFRTGDRDSQGEVFDEPLWTGLQTECDPALAPRYDARESHLETETGLITGPGGTVIAIGQVVEARNRGRGHGGGRGGSSQPAPPGPPPVRVTPIHPTESPIWEGLRHHRGETRTNGLSGSDRRYYDWDHLHGHIEVFDRRPRHLGTADPITGVLDESAANPNHRPRNGPR